MKAPSCLLLALFQLAFAHMHFGGPVPWDVNCGVTKGCYHDCSGNECGFLVSWQSSGDTVEFTLSFDLQDSDQRFIALGLSKDVKMGSDSVIECVMLGANGNTDVYLSYNADEGNSNSRNQDPKKGIVSSNSSIENGIFTCTIVRSTTVNDPKIYNLNEAYYLLFANGKMSGGTKLPHSFDKLPSISPKKADLQSTEDLSGSRKFYMVKAHGCLMVFAWVFAASIGIVLARYYKLVWSNSTLCKEKVWFQLHRTLMISAFLCVIAGVIIIFVEVNGWSDLQGTSRFQKAHPILGIIVTALAIINPCMAMVRPHPGTKYRFIFNWAHWFVGTVAHMLSALTMIIGVTLSKASVPSYAMWILLAFVIYQFLMEFLLEIHECTLFRKGKASAYSNNPSSQKYRAPGKDTQGSLLKKIMFGLHILIITGFAAALIVIILIN